MPKQFCDPVKRVTTYYVCAKPIFIGNSDYQRLVARAGKGLRGPPKPITPAVNSRIISFASRVKGIVLAAPQPIGSKTLAESGPGYPTKALKCYRVNPSNDVVGGRVYVGGKGKPTDFQKEIEPEKDSDGVLPGDIQRWLSSILGLVISIIIGAIIFVLIFSTVFRNYKEAQHIYDANPLSAHTIKEAVIHGGLFSNN
jgi:hypothetical protein